MEFFFLLAEFSTQILKSSKWPASAAQWSGGLYTTQFGFFLCEFPCTGFLSTRFSNTWGLSEIQILQQPEVGFLNLLAEFSTKILKTPKCPISAAQWSGGLYPTQFGFFLCEFPCTGFLSTRFSNKHLRLVWWPKTAANWSGVSGSVGWIFNKDLEISKLTSFWIWFFPVRIFTDDGWGSLVCGFTAQEVFFQARGFCYPAKVIQPKVALKITTWQRICSWHLSLCFLKSHTHTLIGVKTMHFKNNMEKNLDAEFQTCLLFGVQTITHWESWNANGWAICQ